MKRLPIDGGVWLAGFVLTVIWIYAVGQSWWATTLTFVFALGFLYRSIWPRRRDDDA